ncbi:GGDEF domain-containing protein [Methylobacterium nodulans]|uniref:diguanylate cyclase n=1 Tax=Methylobacterium nodulans (strain LMG 21967 / CNCM I-2342 / ORS 2060) TaxID=460265 RepID=B8IUY4_METNO|nr:GGDEF domain-containing protein [Methylobacterium nodulans]ACL59042.1 diguanylate cyclase [Methylobacterium nodulans ORS 2060]
MILDAPTLMAVTVFVALIVGMLFLLSWGQARRTQALAVWGLAHLIGAGGSALLCGRGVIPDWLSIGLANTLLLLAYGMIWSGARSFEGRRTAPTALMAAPALWIAACLVPAFYESVTARVILASSAASVLCLLCAHEFWRGRPEPLVSRGPAILLLASQAALYAVRIPASLVFPVPAVNPVASPWVAVLCFAALLYMVAIAFLFMALAKERLEWEQRLSALTDPLTGVVNRRGLEERASVLLASGRATLLLFDLDHFKRINDTFGHGIGDAVLVGFCTLARTLLPPQAVFGRLGGEEFACVLPGDSAAEPIAETIRHALAGMRAECIPNLRVTVSVGAARGEAGLDALLERADRALYRAKRLGRDRVVWDGPAPRPVREISAAS